MKPPYLLLENGQATGPHSLLVLRQKAEIRVLGPEASVRPSSSPDAPWLPIRAIPDLHDLLFPPKTAPALATSRCPTRADAVAATAAPCVEVQSLLQDNTSRLVASERFDPGAIPDRRLRRHRAFFLAVAVFAAPASAFYRFGPLPRTETTLLTLACFVGATALVSYWIIYHVTDFRS